MPATPENSCVPTGSSVKKATAPHLPSGKASAEPCVLPACAQLQQEHHQLQERFLRTNNALASAAHDLKTPLAILNGYVELLQSEKLGELNDRQREVIGDMRSNGQRLQHFIEDFLSFSVLETGQIKLRYEAADMNACLSEVCRLWSPRFNERKLALYFLANDKLTEFSFDVPKVERVVSNLLENASKFTPSGGTVWLHGEPYMWDRRVERRSEVKDDRRRKNNPLPNSVKVSVSDTGPGIPAEYHIEVFDDFFRLPQNARQSDGTGLGLATARRLVNTMGGKIWVESEPGAGCKFSFIIPMTALHAGKG
jgi:signal transduction histidine kinase